MKASNPKIQSLRVEISLLNNCKENSTFVERVVNNFIPLVRKQFLSFVKSWEKKNQNEDLTKIAIEELSQAFLLLWQHAQNSSQSILKRELIKMLQFIRGPWIITFPPLPDYAYWNLQKLIFKHLPKQIKSFAPNAGKFVSIRAGTRFFERNKNLDPSLLWQSLTALEKIWEHKNHSFSLIWPRIRCPTAAEVGLEAFKRYNLREAARELVILDKPPSQYEPEIPPRRINRKNIAENIDRLTDEIEGLLLQPKAKELPAERKYSPSKTEQDKHAIQNWCLKWWNDRKELWGYKGATQGDALEAIQKAITKQDFLLFSKYPKRTLLEWMRLICPLSPEQRKRGRKPSAKKAKKEK